MAMVMTYEQEGSTQSSTQKNALQTQTIRKNNPRLTQKTIAHTARTDVHS